MTEPTPIYIQHEKVLKELLEQVVYYVAQAATESALEDAASERETVDEVEVALHRKWGMAALRKLEETKEEVQRAYVVYERLVYTYFKEKERREERS